MADIGWITLDDAATYFVTRLGEADWNGLNDDQRTAALTTAYNRIRYCERFDIPAVLTAAQKLVLADAQCEMAKYMVIHLQDEDRRKGLQAQGVTEAGIVQEIYDKDSLAKLPIPPIVLEILGEFHKYDEAFGMVDVDRDEDESVATKVDEF